jgi:hypothetical protein
MDERRKGRSKLERWEERRTKAVSKCNEECLKRLCEFVNVQGRREERRRL